MYGGRGGDVFTLASVGGAAASSAVAGSSIVAGNGVVVLPHTGESLVATVLAYAAVSIGTAALLSQLTVRVLKRIYG